VAWSKRRSKAYYYRKVRTTPGCWEKQYVGGGPSAEAAATSIQSGRKHVQLNDTSGIRNAIASQLPWRQCGN
jgi:hypothetical protein